MTLRVLLVDDHPVVREGYRRLLDRALDIEVVAEAGTADEAYRLFCEHAPDVVVMDISLPGVSGMEAIRHILSREPQARVLAFSMHDDAVFGSRALRAGARGYVTKASAPEVLIEAVRAVSVGRVFISNDMAQKLAVDSVQSSEAPLGNLSPREFEVFLLLAEGRRLVDIARILSLSEKTVANYQWSIKQKLEAHSSAQMVKIAMERGLVRKP